MAKYETKMGPFEGNRSGLGRALRLVLGTGLALSAIGCGSSPAPKARTAGSARAKRPARWGARRPSTTRSARRAPPTSSPRRRSAPSPRTSAPTSRRRCSATRRPRSRAASPAPSAAASRRPSSRSPTATPASPRRDSIRAPCWPSAASKTRRSGIWKGQTSYGPAIANRRLPGLEAGRAARGRVAFQPGDQGRPSAHGRGAQQPGADPARQGPPRFERRREEAVRRAGGQQPAHRAGARQQQPAGVLDAGVHLLRHEHVGDGEAGREPGRRQGRRDRHRQVRRREGRRGRRGQGRPRGRRGRRRRRRAAATTPRGASWPRRSTSTKRGRA